MIRYLLLFGGTLEHKECYMRKRFISLLKTVLCNLGSDSFLGTYFSPLNNLLFFEVLSYFNVKAELHREGKILLHPLLHAPDGQNGWSWTSLKPGATNLFFHVSYVSSGAQALESSSAAFLGYLQGAGSERGAARA